MATLSRFTARSYIIRQFCPNCRGTSLTTNTFSWLWRREIDLIRSVVEWRRGRRPGFIFSRKPRPPAIPEWRSTFYWSRFLVFAIQPLFSNYFEIISTSINIVCVLAKKKLRLLSTILTKNAGVGTKIRSWFNSEKLNFNLGGEIRLCKS